MSREIKFRAWNITDSVMINDLNTPSLYHGILVFDADDIIMQFTGLLDKNGNEIYENDLVKDKYDTCEVIYEKEGYTPFTYSGGGEMDPSECEVVGDIYQHPHLLKS